MHSHPIHKKIPKTIAWAGDTKLRVKKVSSSNVPPIEGKNWKKNPLKNRDLLVRKRDHYFLFQLYSIYGSQPFQRGDLDAGRLNSLWCRDLIQEVHSANHAGDPSAIYKLNINNLLGFISESQHINDQ